MELQLRAKLSFGEHANLVLDGFLPLSTAPNFVSLGGTGFDAAIVMDPSEHRGWLGDLDVENVERHFGILVAGLSFLLRRDVPDEVAASIADGVHSRETEKFGTEVLAAIHLIHDSLEDFARNDHHQYWLPTRLDSEECLQQQLMGYDVRFLTPAGWKLLDVAPNDVTIELAVSRGIDISDWARLQERLERGPMRSLPHRRFLANAFALMTKGDHRAAIVEAVAAWETAVNTQAPPLLAERGIGFEEADWKKFIEQAGLRATTRLLFALLMDVQELFEHKDAVLRALDLRNNVIHNGQRRVNRTQLVEALRSIRGAIRACEGEQAVPDALRWAAASSSEPHVGKSGHAGARPTE